MAFCSLHICCRQKKILPWFICVVQKRVQATCLYKLPFFSQKTALTREKTVFAWRTFIRGCSFAKLLPWENVHAWTLWRRRSTCCCCLPQFLSKSRSRLWYIQCHFRFLFSGAAVIFTLLFISHLCEQLFNYRYDMRLECLIVRVSPFVFHKSTLSFVCESGAAEFCSIFGSKIFNSSSPPERQCFF